MMQTESSLDGRSALVTGGSRGLGAAIAVRLAARGAKVTLTYHAHPEAAEKILAEIGGADGGHRIVRCDIEEQADIASLVATVGECDILINNAGGIARPSDWQQVGLTELRSAYAQHAIAPTLLIQAFAPGMKERGYGRIINIGTTYALRGSAAVVAYTGAKAALWNLTTAMASELADGGVTVNLVAPGNFDTDLTHSAGPDVVSWAISTTPAQRLGYPVEVASAVDYLIDNPFITGAAIPLDGGQQFRI
jgi:3-oxoacyl-[acyl-carrier protein] reductase